MALRELFNEIGFNVNLGCLKKADQETDKFERDFIQSFEQMGFKAEYSLEGIGNATPGLNRDLNRTENEMRDIGMSALEAERNVNKATEGMKQDIKEVGKAADKTSEGIDFQALAGAGGLGLASSTMEGYEASAGHLRAQLGMTKEEAEEFNVIAKEIYKNNFGETFRDAADATSFVYRGLKLTGGELQTQTENAIKLRDVFDYDLRESVSANRAMTAAWGTDAQKNFDLITMGAQHGVDSAGDLLDTFTEYPSYFAQIGLTADDMFKYLEIGMSKTNGAFNTDYLADAIKEFGIRIRTEGDTAQEVVKELFPQQEAARLLRDFGRGGEAGREAFYTVMQQLNKVEDPIKRYTTGVALLGTKFEDLTDFQMTGIIKELAGVKDQTLQTEGATATLGAEYDGLNKAIEGFKRQFETSVLGSLGGFGEILPDVLQGGANLGMTILGLQGLGINFGTVMSVGTRIVGGFGAAIGFLTSPIGLVLLALGALVAAGVLLYQNWDTVKGFMVGIFESIGGAAKGFANSAIGAINSVINSVNALHFTVPEWVPSLGGKEFGLNIPQIPMLAAGGRITSPGSVLVGERGPELLNLPGGASVSPLPDEGSDGSASSITFAPQTTVYYNGPGGEQEGQRIARIVDDRIRASFQNFMDEYFAVMARKRPAMTER